MKISIHGVRGSIPTTDPGMAYYGGNTSCTVAAEKDCILVLDGGSGMQKFNLPNHNPSQRIDVLLTHLHMDHIQGLGFFSPFYNPSLDVHVWGPATNAGSLHSRLSRYLSPPLFPILLRDLPCKLTLHEIGNSSFDIGPFHIESRFVIHPGPTVGFRVSGEKSVFTYIPDHEPMIGCACFPRDKRWVSGIDLALDADLLLHDAQYSATEYQHKQGWGHSSIDDAVKFAELATAKRLLLAHHDPSHTDAQLNKLLADLGGKSYSVAYELAVEGTTIELP